MANKTIGQLTQLTVGTGLGTDEIPIYHDNSTYKTTKNELFEGLGSKTFSGLNTDVKTITGAINELDKQLQEYIINKHANLPDQSVGADDYYVRIGINKGTSSQFNYLPYAYMDIRDMANRTENPEHSGYYYGELKNAFRLYGPNSNHLKSNAFQSYDIISSKNNTFLSHLSGNASTNGMPEITQVTALDNIEYNNTLYWTRKGVDFNIDSNHNYFYIKQIQAGNYKTQFAYGYSLNNPLIKVRNKNSEWGSWKTLCEDAFSLSVTPGTGVGSGFVGGCKNGFAYLSFACVLQAGTYTGQSSILFTVNKNPIRECRFLTIIGSSPQVIILRTNGQAILNNNYTVPSGGQYLQGNIIYPYQ